MNINIIPTPAELTIHPSGQEIVRAEDFSLSQAVKSYVKKAEELCLNEKVCVFWRSEAISYHAVCVGFRTSHTPVHILSGRRMQKSLL